MDLAVPCSPMSRRMTWGISGKRAATSQPTSRGQAVSSTFNRLGQRPTTYGRGKRSRGTGPGEDHGGALLHPPPPGLDDRHHAALVPEVEYEAITVARHSKCYIFLGSVEGFTLEDKHGVG